MRVVYTALVSIIMPFLALGTEPNFNLHLPVGYTPWENISYIFAHGLGATQTQAHGLIPTNNHYWILGKPLVLFDFPDAKPNPLEYHREFVNFGQQGDIDRLRYAFYKAKQELPDHDFVMVGISRGAVTIINCLSLHPECCGRALVLESPFDSFKSVIEHLLKRFHVGWVPFSKKIALKYVKKTFPHFDIHGIAPNQTIENLPLDLPIAIVHSSKDKTIPVRSSYKLYIKLLKTNHKNVYLIILPDGEHGKLLQGPSGEVYQNTIHAFYKKCDLPHEPEFAKKGEELLKMCQPSIEDVQQYLLKRNISDSAEQLFLS